MKLIRINGFDEILYAQNLDIQFWKWTINNPDDMLYAMSKGVDGLITDNPQDLYGLKSLLTNYGLVAHWNFDQGGGGTPLSRSRRNIRNQWFLPLWAPPGAPEKFHLLSPPRLVFLYF